MPVDPFKVLYPGTPAGITFDGGINTKYQKALLPDNESPDNLNVIYTQQAVETRGGTAKLNATAVGAFACDGLFTRHDQTGATTMVAWFGGTMWQLATTTFSTVPSAQAVYAAGTRVVAAEQENKMFLCNGTSGNIPYKYDGTYFTRHGVYPPATNPSLGSPSGSGGPAANTYKLKVTYVNSASVEGNVSSNATAFVAAGATSTVYNIPTAAVSWGVSSRKIYADNGSGTYRLQTTINDNTTTTYDFSTYTVGTAAPTDNGVPPAYGAIVSHRFRLFMQDPTQLNYVWYTDWDGDGPNPYRVRSDAFFRVGDNAGDLVRGFAVFDAYLVTFCDSGTYLTNIDDPSDSSSWVTVKVKIPYGSKSPRGAVNFANQVLFPAIQNGQFVGFSSVSGLEPTSSTAFLTVGAVRGDLQSDKIEPDMLVVPEASLTDIAAIVFENKAYIALPYGSGQTSNNRIYVFDFSRTDLSAQQKFTWSPWTGLNANAFTINGGVLYYGSSTANGFVYKMNQTTYSDSGSAINSYYYTKEFSGLKGDENNQKDFRKVDMLYSALGAWNMNFGWRLDSDKSDPNTIALNLDPGSSLWGTMIWGIDNWSAGVNDKESLQPLGAARGKRIQFYFSNQNTAAQGFRIIRMRFTYNRKGKR